MTQQQALRQTFPHFRDWLRFWCQIHQNIMHIEQSNKRFFYGNSSYMDLGELLRKNEGADSSPCMIYDTDIHDNKTNNSKVLNKIHTFYICVLTDNQLDGESIKDAKDLCESLALELMAWFYACKAEGNSILKGCDFGSIDSTTPFLNGWEAIRISVSQPLAVGCPTWNHYNYENVWDNV